MKHSATVAGRVLRLYARSLLVAALAIVVVGGGLSGMVAVRRDDDGAMALARTLGSELTNHASEPRTALDKLVRHELEEGRWFARQIEVWRRGERIGGDALRGLLRPYASLEEGCRSAVVGGRRERVCTARASEGLVVVVSSPLRPVIVSLLPVLAVVGAAAFVTIVLTVAVGRRLVAASLAPLSRFERRIAALRDVGEDDAVEESWGVGEVDALAATFNQLLERISAGVRRERRFVGDAAHELRTPLTRLRAQLELACAEIIGGKDPTARVMAAARSCQELMTTTETLLALARNQASAEDAVDLADVVSACQEEVDVSEQGRLHLQLGDAQAIVRGDEALLRLATNNLIDNSLKYSTGPVWVRVDQASEAVRLSVDDLGPGIPWQDIQRMREPFVRGARRSPEVRGAGLGLALVSHVAILHGGTLEIENRAGGGLHTVIRLAPWQPAGRPMG